MRVICAQSKSWLSRDLENRRIRVTGDTYEARDFLIAQFPDKVQRSTFGLDAGEIFGWSELVNVNQVHLIHLERLQTLLHHSWGLSGSRLLILVARKMPSRRPLIAFPTRCSDKWFRP